MFCDKISTLKLKKPKLEVPNPSLEWEGVKLVPADRGICYSPSWLDVDDREVMAIGGGEGGWGGKNM